MIVPSDFSPEEREERAVEFFGKGYNCSQSVAMAFADITGLDESVIAKLSTGFGGGMGRMREVCGAFSGMTMIAGSISPVKDPTDMKQREANYALVQEFAAAFRDANGGSIICRELLARGASAPQESESPKPSERNAAFYHKRPCIKIVRNAARIVAEKIMSLK